MEIDYLTVLHVRLGIKIRDIHAKDSYSFRNGQIEFIVCETNENPWHADP